MSFTELMDRSNLFESTVYEFFGVVFKFHLRFYLTTEDYLFIEMEVETITNVWQSVSL
jgi:NADH:ubiquinone oxidoreductase subunit C